MKNPIATARKRNVSKVIAKRPAWRMASLLTTSALVAGGLVAISSPQAMAAVGSLETPTGGQVVGGSATITLPQAGQLDINQTSNRAVINWDTFNIGTNATTQFFQPGSGSLAVNRVTGAGQDPAQILGTLKSNGQVMILDRNGVLFGRGATIDVGGIVASTGDIDTASVMNGNTKLVLSNFGAGSVINNATINVADAGLAAFVSPFITNNGVINVKLGKVGFGSGSKVTLDLYGDNLLEIAVNDKAASALIKQAGTINAQGGTVLMTAQAAKGALDDVINMNGVVNVSSATVQGGKIVLSGGAQGQVAVAGNLNASGEGGGSINVTGQTVNITDAAALAADGGQNGTGGIVNVFADSSAIFEGSISAQGGALSGDGGAVEISTGGDLLLTGSVDTLAVNGLGGSLLIDPTNLTIYNGADATNFINAQTLANLLKDNGTVTEQATDTINVGVGSGTGSGDVDISTSSTTTTTYTSDLPENAQACNGPAAGHNPHCIPSIATSSSIELGNLTLQSGTVDFNTNLIMGAGNLTVDAGTINLGAQVFGRSTVGGETSTLGDSRLIGTAALATINVLSPSASINQGIDFADDATDMTTVNVGAGTYDEDVVLNKDNVTVKGASDHASIITPHSPGFVVSGDYDTVDGFAIDGSSVAGVQVTSSADYASILNNTINPTSGNGVEIDGGSNQTVSGNAITGGAEGIRISNAGGVNLIDGNSVDGTSGDAIDGEFNSALTVSNNKIGLGADGIANTDDDSAIGGNGIEINYGVLTQNSVLGNTVDHAALDGILVDPSPSVPAVAGTYDIIEDNNVDNSGKNGIESMHNSDVTITGNTVNRSGNDGIYAVGGVNIEIGTLGHGNTVDNSGNAGIGVTGVDVGGNAGTVSIAYNTVDTTGGNGIAVTDIPNATIAANNVQNTGHDGIFVDPSPYTDIYGNTINFTGNDGIHVVSSDGTRIHDNQIGQNTGGEEDEVVTGSIGNNGIEVEGSQYVDIDSNNVANAGNDGIYAHAITVYDGEEGYVSYGSDHLSVTGNNVDASGNNGIEVQNSNYVTIGGLGEGDGNYVTNSGNDGIKVGNVFAFNYGGEGEDSSLVPNVFITGNTVDETGNNGIEVNNVAFSQIDHNQVSNAGQMYNDNWYAAKDGILVTSGEGEVDPTNIQSNGVYNSAHNGIEVDGVDTVAISGNTVDTSGWNGIAVYDSGDVTIGGTGEGDSNTVTNSGWNGINAVWNNTILIAGNHVTDSGDDGIYVADMFGDSEEGTLATISGNTVDWTGWNGIEIHDVTSSLIDGNFVGTAGQGEEGSNIGHDGILVTSGGQEDPTTISNNTVSNAGFSGIEVNGVDEAYVLSNVITNSGANGFFASGPNNGLVVLAGNTFNDNPVGANFESGVIDLTGATNFINGGDIGLLFRPYQSEGCGDCQEEFEGNNSSFAPMSLVGNTIGTTTFTGQSTYYVDLENGAFFDPGKPTILNGLNATYDGLRPSDTDGVLTVAQYDRLEAMIHHYIDDQTLGLFFFGFIPDTVEEINQSDIFHHITGYKVGPHGFHVTVNGLPPVTGNGGGAGGLANIEPAAGGDDGTTAGDAANIEPAAGGTGGQTTSCWTQAVTNAAHGVTTIYSFGDSLESQLAGAAGCGG